MNHNLSILCVFEGNMKKNILVRVNPKKWERNWNLEPKECWWDFQRKSIWYRTTSICVVWKKITSERGTEKMLKIDCNTFSYQHQQMNLHHYSDLWLENISTGKERKKIKCLLMCAGWFADDGDSFSLCDLWYIEHRAGEPQKCQTEYFVFCIHDIYSKLSFLSFEI